MPGFIDYFLCFRSPTNCDNCVILAGENAALRGENAAIRQIIRQKDMIENDIKQNFFEIFLSMKKNAKETKEIKKRRNTL